MRNLLALLLVTAACNASEVVGFHGDGSGVYPKANPPTEWSANTNVVWRTPMPNWSNASPTVVGERVFVMSKPVDCVPLLLCLDANGAAVEGLKRDLILGNSNCAYWMPKGYQTIACHGDRLYIRTHDDLWCIGRR